jgi:hypothetical protein
MTKDAASQTQFLPSGKPAHDRLVGTIVVRVPYQGS